MFCRRRRPPETQILRWDLISLRKVPLKEARMFALAHAAASAFREDVSGNLLHQTFWDEPPPPDLLTPKPHPTLPHPLAPTTTLPQSGFKSFSPVFRQADESLEASFNVLQQPRRPSQVAPRSSICLLTPPAVDYRLPSPTRSVRPAVSATFKLMQMSYDLFDLLGVLCVVFKKIVKSNAPHQWDRLAAS